MTAAYIAFITDCIIGDPRSDFHPVVLIGKLIAILEKIFYREKDSDSRKFFSGFALMILVLVITYSIALGIIKLSALLENRYAALFTEGILLSFMISPKSLASAGEEIRLLLLSGDITEARRKVGWIVGRDTERLTVGEATRATVETVAENIVDGIISPLFFFALGGLPLAAAYRAANTMDSMIGYKNDKYLYFGRAAARADDVWNYIPARITGILLVVAAFLLRFDWRGALRMIIRDAKKHPSPNGGWPESAVAGALGIRLGGLNYYFGKPHMRATMGDALHELAPEHITATARMMYMTTLLFLLCMGAVDAIIRNFNI